MNKIIIFVLMFIVVTSSSQCAQKAKANANKEATNDLVLAAKDGAIYDIEEALEAGADINGKADLSKKYTQSFDEISGHTALGQAALHSYQPGYEKVVEYLLKNGAQVNITSKSKSPLMLAIGARNIEVINALLKAGADVNFRTSGDKKTALMLATVQAFSTQGKINEIALKIINTLLDNKADMYACDSMGRTAYDITLAFGGHKEILEAFEKRGYNKEKTALVPAQQSKPATSHELIEQMPFKTEKEVPGVVFHW